MDIAGMIQAISEPLGLNIGTKTLVMDYRDDNNKYFNVELNMMVLPNTTDEMIAKYLIDTYESQGFTVYSIHEVLNGYSNAEVEEMIAHDSLEALSHIRYIYIDLTKERNASIQS